jgi:hypothetical protein
MLVHCLRPNPWFGNKGVTYNPSTEMGYFVQLADAGFGV